MKKLIITGALLVAQGAFATVNNGDFESFTNGQPDGWTTIDSGIEVSQSSTAYRGNSSASITVNTATQGSTDFRQSVEVSSGETYDFSVWVYHTEGNMSARLYVDGYQGYSNASQTNQWQQLSYSFTASSSTSIDIGLRFYDQSGFDGSEVVLVDLFEPTTISDTGDTDTSCANTVELSLLTDNYASETSWELLSGSSQISSGSGYSNNTQYNQDFCLDDGDYTFTIYDSYGDGICCNVGSGSYALTSNGTTLASGGDFDSSQSTSFSLPVSSSDNSDNDSDSDTDDTYYASASGLSGYTLKTSLYNIINSHSAQSYSSLWTFYTSYELDQYYENDNTILDIYSERPSSSDPYSFTPSSDQCGNYSDEGDCYNREHSFPRSWFGGAVSPMNTDIHHVFPTDGKVNSYRSSYPYGEVGSASYSSENGSLLGSATSSLGYSGTVFEPIDEFKGDVARAYFYMATRYENVVDDWESNSTYSDAMLDGSSDQVFEDWALEMLKDWHESDPVSQKEIDRNESAYSFQGNRNPFIDHPEYVSDIWGN